MLLDGFWKKDLKSIIKQLEGWRGNRCELFHDYAEHKVNQGLLYSAVINSSTQKQIYGVVMASDHFMKTEAYLLKIDDWIDAIRFVIDNSTI